MSKFLIKKNANGDYWFVLKAANHEVILTSEMYTAKASVKNGIDSVKENAILDENFERKTSKSNEPYFVLRARNNQIIGMSEMYSSIQAMENGIASVAKNAPIAEIDDQS
jgi:uncharacterized protein